MLDLPTLDIPAIHKAEDSPDALPTRGYTMDQLREYIKRMLGMPVWNVELTPQQIQDHILDALVQYSLYKPMHHWGAIPMVAGQKQYLLDADVGQGVAECSFVENRLGVLNMDFSNPFSTMSIMTTGLGLDGMGDYDSYLRWQGTWQRVTSTLPKWQYDEMRHCLWIHNPIARYRASVLIYRNWANTAVLPAFGAIWVKEYALATSRYQLGDLFMKFSGAIPGGGKDLQLDANKRTEAKTEVDKLMEQLKGSQDSCPISQD